MKHESSKEDRKVSSLPADEQILRFCYLRIAQKLVLNLILHYLITLFSIPCLFSSSSSANKTSEKTFAAQIN